MSARQSIMFANADINIARYRTFYH